MAGRNQLALDAGWVNAQLARLTDRGAAAASTAATRSGAHVFKRKLAKAAPDSGEAHPNKLNKSFKVKKKKFNKRDETGTWVLSTAPHAHLVEFGTVQRRPTTPHLAMIDGSLRLITSNGAMPANPFFRGSVDNSANKAQAMKAMRNTYARQLMSRVRRSQM